MKYLRSRKAGAMLVGGSLAMLALLSAGGMLADYGWREAQEEEMRTAFKAGIASASHLMRGDLTDPATEQAVKERIADFMVGMLDNLKLDADDITIATTPTGDVVISIGGNAKYIFTPLWGGVGSESGTGESLSETVTVRFDASEYEFALALDVSISMGQRPTGWTATKLDVLKDSIRAIADTVEAASLENPGIAAIALVPFASAVNVADTSGPNRTAAKERYVRMLVGADYNTQAARDTTGHWFDAYLSYGTGSDMGALQSLSLPDFTLPQHWDLRGPQSVDISRQAPETPTWTFAGADFWNGCVLARWGAYWHADARPLFWNPEAPENFPAKKTVAGWEPGSAPIANLPLHISDAPPDVKDPHTRFVAYSYPDARISGFADHSLVEVMRRTIDPTYSHPFPHRSAGENHWSVAADRGGSLFCPETAIVPLTDDGGALASIPTIDLIQQHSATLRSQTFLHLGVAWALRTLSPLWRDVWRSKSASGDDLPRTPCSPGQTADCSPLAEKTIVLITDGANYFGNAARGRTFGSFEPRGSVTSNPAFNYGWCDGRLAIKDFADAIGAPDAASFAQHFDTAADGTFSPDGLSAVLDAFQAEHPSLFGVDPTNPAHKLVIDVHRAIWSAALKDMTPWQLFRGRDENAPDAGVDAADALSDDVFGLGGRPIRDGHICRPHSPFSAYGRAQDLMSVGDAPPLEGRAPFADEGWKWTDPASDLNAPMARKLDQWLMDACDLAGGRGVRVHAIYIGGNSTPWDQGAIDLLGECVARGAGGSVHVTPTEPELREAVESVIDIRRVLRFVDG